MNKRGMSNILATVLVILLVIILIVILWMYYRTSVINSAEQVQLEQKCTITSAEAVKCMYKELLVGQFKYYFFRALVKQTAGEPANYIAAFKFSDTTSRLSYINRIPLLGTKEITPAFKEKQEIYPISVVVTPIVYNEQKTKNLTCPISAQTQCNLDTSAGGNLCDDITTYEDVDPFVLALTDPVAYNKAFPSCDIINADFNCDGVIGFQDIDNFVKTLVNQWNLCGRTQICTDHGQGNCWHDNGNWCNDNCKPQE